MLFCISCTLLTLALWPVLQTPNCHCGKYPVKNPLSSHWQYHRHLLVSQWKPPTAKRHAKQSNEFNGMLLLNYTIKAALQKSKLYPGWAAQPSVSPITFTQWDAHFQAIDTSTVPSDEPMVTFKQLNGMFDFMFLPSIRPSKLPSRAPSSVPSVSSMQTQCVTEHSNPVCHQAQYSATLTLQPSTLPWTVPLNLPSTVALTVTFCWAPSLSSHPGDSIRKLF